MNLKKINKPIMRIGTAVLFSMQIYNEEGGAAVFSRQMYNVKCGGNSFLGRFA
jgi:hypothetical protein